jgi:hypothetical protein
MTTPTIVTPDTNNVTANCYVDVANADLYFAGRFGGESWEALDTDQKTRLLMTSTRRIDTEPFGGYKVQGGALSWCRSGLIDSEGYEIGSTTIPVNLKNATYEQAFYYLKEMDITMLEPQSLELFSDVSIGSIKLTTKEGVANLLAQETRNQLKKLGQGVWLGEDSAGSAKTYNMFR